MTDPNKTLLGVLVDRSGSMMSIKKDMEGGLNTLIKEQRELTGECEITLAQFDNRYENICESVPLQDFEGYELIPRGSTSLLDAIGKFVTEIGQSLSTCEEDKRPGQVIIVIITDGHENSSREWKWTTVKELIKNQESQWSWKFVFLGANIDAEAVGMDLGIDRGSTITYAATADGVGNTMSSLSNYVASTRSGVAASFTEEDRKNSVK